MNFLDELPHISMRSEIEKFVKRLHMFLAHVNAHLNLRMRVIKKDQVKQALSVQEKLLYVMKRLNRVARRFLGYTEPLPISGGV